jgi:hypothetical protein
VSTDVSEEHIASIFTCLLAGFAEPISSTLTMEAMFLRNVGWHSTDYTALLCLPLAFTLVVCSPPFSEPKNTPSKKPA